MLVRGVSRRQAPRTVLRGPTRSTLLSPRDTGPEGLLQEKSRHMNKSTILLVATLLVACFPGRAASSPVEEAVAEPIPQRRPAVVIEAPPFSKEGVTETIALHFDREVHGDVDLDVYTFHYPMHPELAIEEDTWVHEGQMDHMREVLAGLQEPYAPDPEAPATKRILESSAVRTLEMATDDHRTFTTPWNARHGRILFRPRLNGAPLAAVASTRVHCTHVDMRSVEKLKESLRVLALPIEHGHGELADRLLQQVRSVYTQGHSLRHMLVHHQFGAAELDDCLADLEGAVTKRDWSETLRIIERFEHGIARAERNFYSVGVESVGGRIRLTLEDRIQAFDFAGDPETELFLKRGPAIDPEQLHARVKEAAQAGDRPGAGGHDPAMHGAMMRFDREELTRGAVRLSPADGGFQVTRDSLRGDSEQLTLIALYGEGQAFYLTRELALPAGR